MKIRFGIFHCALALMAAVSGCQSSGSSGDAPFTKSEQVVPIDEAKKTLAEFNKVEFKAPPRSSTDILDLLKADLDPNSAERKRLIAEATAEIPATASNHEILISSFSRSRAAGALGWNGVQIRELRRSLEIIEKSERGEAMGFGLEPSFPKAIRRDAAWAEFSDGNFQRSAALFRKAANAYDGGWTFDRSDWRELSGLAMAYASVGDLKSATEWARYAKESIDDASSTTGTIWSGQDRRNPWRRIYELTTGAEISEVQGKWREAEEALRNAIQLYEEELGSTAGQLYGHGRAAEWQELQRVKLARNVMAQGRYPEAEVVAREALSIALAEKGKYAKTTAILLGVFVDLMMAEGRFEEADALAEQILKIYDVLKTPPDSRLRGAAAFQRAATQALSGHARSALRGYQAVRVSFDRNRKTFDRFFGSDPTYLLTMAKSGSVDVAKASVQNALSRSERNRGRDHYDTAELLAMSAIIEARSGDKERAIRSFSRAIETMIEKDRQARASGSILPVKRKRLQIIIEAYIGQLTEDRGRTDANIAEAFRLASFAQGHTVEWALAKALARRQTVKPALGTLIRSEQNAELQLDALYRLLNRALVEHGKSKNAVTQQLRSQISVLERSRDSVQREIARQFPDYVTLINPPPMTIDAVQGLLKPGESLISFFVGEDRTYVWAIPFAGAVAFHIADAGRDRIDHTVQVLRRALDPDPVTLADIPSFNVELAHELYAILLAPASRGWEKSNALIVVPHGSLAQLPLTVLPTKPVSIGEERDLLFSEYRKVAWLARSHSISTLPSVTSLRSLRQPTSAMAANGKRFIGFGDPIFSQQQAVQMASAVQSRGKRVAFRAPVSVRTENSADLSSLPRLPDTAVELRAVAEALGSPSETSVFLGKDASEAKVKSANLSQTSIISFATHGLVPGDLDGLEQPALALTSPIIAGGTEDGLLTMEEITALRLNADWVVLSACNTAAAAGEGAEAVSGLGQAFFFAGARALLVSNWPVHSAATTDLMTTLFTRYGQDASFPRDRALRDAVIALMEKGTYRSKESSKPLFSYAHPIFWAPFTLVGEPKPSREAN